MTTMASQDTIELQRRRRSAPPPTLAGPGPTGEELTTILTLAARVPDHGKLAPWRFIVFEGEGRERAGEVIAAIYRADNPDADDKRLEIEKRRLAQAPIVVGIVSKAMPHAKIPEWEQVLSSGAVAMNLVLAANALGYATAWLTEWYAYDRRTLAGFGLSEAEKMAGFVHIGRPTAVIEDRIRPVIDELVTRF